MRLRIFEPPRFFEAFLRGRAYTEVPDITARICGICPVAYQMSSIAAMEDVCGVEAPEPVRALRRLLYCGEWIESHALHVFFLHGPDFLGYDSAFAMARDHRVIVERALQLKKAGNALMRVVGGREIHPINVRARRLLPRAHARRARPGRRGAARWRGSSRARRWRGPRRCRARTSTRTSSSWRCARPDRYAIESGRLASSGGLDLAPAEYEEHFAERQVPHSTALHSRLRDGRAYLTGPLARYALSGDRLSPVAREAAADAGLGPVCRNPFKSIVVRAVEILYAVDEALRLLDAYEPPDPPAVPVAPRAGTGYGWTEAPRGMLWHRYEIDGEGTILDARIVPPTSQNQARIEQSLATVVEAHATLADDELQRRCEQAVRSFDPCISCATHFLRLEIERC